MTAVVGEILGWDVGGANIKLVRIRSDRRDLLTVAERPFPLWRELPGLPSMLAAMANDVAPASAMALTMTAELAVSFATKREGVAAIIGAAEQAFPASALWVRRRRTLSFAG